MTTDLLIDNREARAALTEAGRRTAALIRSVADPALAVRGSAWTVGEVGAHLAAGLRGFTDAAKGDNATVATFFPPAGSFADRLSAVTAGTLSAEPEREPVPLSGLIAARVEDFLASTAGLPGHQQIATPWYGDGASLSLSTATAMLVGEQLVHGYDVAATVGRPWPISVPEAHLVIRGITSMLPLSVNPSTVAGRRMSYRVNVGRGGPRFVVSVADGAAEVEPAGTGRVDCQISADPVTLVLVGYGRVGQWGPIVRGKLRAGGRRPWLALRFTSLFFNP
ncbi:MAG: hypothetical protein M3Y91_17000 [Actinomycetota bacterium]|nr:hypothetical protein [Actinomycetota bacterium]